MTEEAANALADMRERLARFVEWADDQGETLLAARLAEAQDCADNLDV